MAQHIKRQLIPTFWRLAKKDNVFTYSPSPGAHKKAECIPLGVLVRDILQLTQTGNETKHVLAKGSVLVDARKRTKPDHPVGLFDVIQIPEIKKNYSVVAAQSGLQLEEISSQAAKSKVCKIVGKTTLAKGMAQLHLHDGRCILLKQAEAKKYKTSDSVLISLEGQKVEKHMEFKVGQQALIFSGKNIGVKGKIKEIRNKKTMLEKNLVVVESAGKDIITIKDYVMAV